MNETEFTPRCLSGAAEVGFSYNGLQRHTGIRRDTY